ncbi:uncharacterized protein LOC124699298 [Lolium rigidum]|uniref:uncharacterized protein LOC124699298 n=1 Tax=Lolium rigidum TaxID=89674 RepID=UPI001F5C9FF8|nr:uncharacterized protein LOC124699298 [Lolium rigidum]
MPKPAMAHPTPSNSLITLSLLLLFASSQAAQGASPLHQSVAGHVPVRAVLYRSVERATTTAAAGDEAPGVGGGRYEPFELCMGCRCCLAAAAGPGNNGSSSCVDTRCCYAIDCNVPGKPFGVCAFSPRTCGCGGEDAGVGGGDNCTSNH